MVHGLHNIYKTKNELKHKISRKRKVAFHAYEYEISLFDMHFVYDCLTPTSKHITYIFTYLPCITTYILLCNAQKLKKRAHVVE